MTLDNDKIDRAILALLYLGLHDTDRAWKGFDWEAMNRDAAKASYRVHVPAHVNVKAIRTKPGTQA